MKGIRETEPLFVLFDIEEEYAVRMSDYIRNYPGLPWRVRTYSDIEELMRFEEGNRITLLVVSENSFSEDIEKLQFEKMVILNESGFRPKDTVDLIDKYQAADSVVQILLQAYIEIAGEQPGRISVGNKTIFIGIYSPVKRCLQTTFALTMSGLLAHKKRTLYLNFESYCGMAEILSRDGEQDLSDLVYFLNVDNEKFKLHLQTMTKQFSEFEYVPPMRYGQNLLSVSDLEWMNLLRKISETELFDYVIMDLTDSLQGLPEILRICSRVFTIMKDDQYARIKMSQYEAMMVKYEYKDVIEKTERFVFPKFHYVPMSSDQFTRGDMAEFVREKMDETGVV